jgi:hypothetical protein
MNVLPTAFKLRANTSYRLSRGLAWCIVCYYIISSFQGPSVVYRLLLQLRLFPIGTVPVSQVSLPSPHCTRCVDPFPVLHRAGSLALTLQLSQPNAATLDSRGRICLSRTRGLPPLTGVRARAHYASSTAEVSRGGRLWVGGEPSSW